MSWHFVFALRCLAAASVLAWAGARPVAISGEAERPPDSPDAVTADAVPADAVPADTVPADETAAKPEYETLSLRGRVVWLAEALRRRFGIKTDPDAAESQVALETPGGELHLIAKDNRGRGFMIDPRLRDEDMELLVRRYRGSPVVQVIRIRTFKGNDQYELDYWCDICAIQMFELKNCECCQGPTRIRERRVTEGNSSP